MSDKDFDKAIRFIIFNLEGGDKLLIDDDGVTKYGICSRWHKEIDVPTLTYEGAVEVYQWYRAASKFDDYEIKIGIIILDCYINMQFSIASAIRKQVDSLAIRGEKYWELLILARIFYYLELANHNKKERDNLRGWLNRCRKLYTFCGQL